MSTTDIDLSFIVALHAPHEDARSSKAQWIDAGLLSLRHVGDDEIIDAIIRLSSGAETVAIGSGGALTRIDYRTRSDFRAIAREDPGVADALARAMDRAGLNQRARTNAPHSG